MNFLLVTVDGGGNIPPELLLAKALVTKGHAVAVLGNNTLEARAKRVGASFLRFSRVAEFDVNDSRDVDELFRPFFDGFVFGESVATDVVAACDEHDVSVILVDSLLYTCLAAAEKTEIPFVALWHTVMSDDRAPYETETGLAALNEVRTMLGLEPLAELRIQSDAASLNLALTSEEFDGPISSLPRNFSYAGPLVNWGDPDSKWSDDSRSLVVVSFSTLHLSYQAGVIQKVLDALETLDIRVLLTLGFGLNSRDLRIPASVEVEQFVPHSEVLPSASLLITHAGYGTVVAGLLSATPMICLPLVQEEAAVANRVSATGVGVRMSSSKVAVQQLRQRIEEALEDVQLAAKSAQFARLLDPIAAIERATSLVESL